MTNNLRIERATPEHADAIGRITFDAFDGVARRHGFEPEIFSREFAMGMGQALTRRPDLYGVVALDGDEVIGSNFLQITDAVGGIGPISIDPKRQCGGVGRMLMKHVIDWCLQNHGPQVRLYQETFNLASMSLYLSLGFDVTEPVAVMSVPVRPDDRSRPLTESDIDEADAMCVRTQKVSRKNELRNMLASGPAIGSVPHGRFENGRMTAFVVPGFFGFAAGESAEDLVAVACHAIEGLIPQMRRIILPSRVGELMRTAMGAGMRTVKIGQMMAMGRYDAPEGFWSPSVSY